LGVLAHELIVGKPPFEMRDMEQTKRNIAKFKGRVEVPEFVSREAGEFISQVCCMKKGLGVRCEWWRCYAD
jgi:hypothetical protein